MIDWSDLTGELPATADPRPSADPRGRGRGADLRTGDVRSGALPAPPAPPGRVGDALRTGDVRAGGPPAPAGPPGRVGDALRTGPMRTEPPRPPVPPGPGLPGPGLAGPGLAGPGLAGPGGPAGPAGPIGPPPVLLPTGGDMVTTGMIRRAELRKHMKIQQQLKGVTLVLVVLLLLAAYPVYLVARSAATDPVFTTLDSLNLPEWAAYTHVDEAEGSRWCIGGCRIRTRTWHSERAPIETQTVYASALQEDGWELTAAGCQRSADESNIVTCWSKDEYVMTMYVYAPLCVAPPTRDPVPGAPPEATPASRVCPGALVTIAVTNAIDGPPQLGSGA